MAGVSRMFFEGAKTVKGFVKAKLNIFKPKAGVVPTPTFRNVGKSPNDTSGYKVEK
jgi:hypothetical protein